MKLLPWLSAVFLAVPFAHADVVLEEKIATEPPVAQPGGAGARPGMNGDLTIKVKGDQARLEVPTPMGQTVILMNMGTGKMTTLLPAMMMGMESDLGALKKQGAAMQKQLGVDVSEVKPVATGEKKKVGEWDAEEYTVTSAGVIMHLWAAPNFPDAKSVRDELSKVSKAMSGGLPDPNSFDVPGMVVEMETTAPALGKVTMTLKSAKVMPVEASDLTIPPGYNVIPASTFGGAGAPGK